MLGFHHSDQRDTDSADSEMLGGTLQSCPPTFQSRTRNTGSEFTEGRTARPTALHSERLPSCSDIDSRWAASRISPGESCRVKRMAFQRAECIFCYNSRQRNKSRLRCHHAILSNRECAVTLGAASNFC